MKIPSCWQLVFSLNLLLILCGCPNDGPKFVFGPAQKNETAMSLKTVTKRSPKQSRMPDEMNKKELLAYIRNLEGKEVEQVKAESAVESKRKNQPNQIKFNVKNVSGKTLYVVCFSYIQKFSYTSWRWDKSAVYKLEPAQTATVEIDPMYSKDVMMNSFGYLGVFETRREAALATYQLTTDHNKLDLDLLYRLNGQTINLEVVDYGAEVSNFDYKISEKELRSLNFEAELDFFVENKTGKTIFVTCFIYEQNDYASELAPWEYVKTSVQRLEPGQLCLIDVASSANAYERAFMRGALAIFDESEELEAEAATFQLLPDSKMVKLDRLSNLKGKKVVLSTEKYGAEGDFIDYVIKTKPRRRPEETVGS